MVRTQDIGLQLRKPMGVDIKRRQHNQWRNGRSLLLTRPEDLSTIT